MRLNEVSKIFFLSMGVLFVLGCATRKQNQEVRRNLFDVQTRLLELERNVKNSSKNAQPVDKRIASISADFEQLQEQLQVINGQINTLEIGVQVGHLPGQAPKEGSIGKRLIEVEQRLVEIEKTQKEILDLITKKKDKVAKRPKKSTALKNLTQLERAFSKRRYKQVAKYGMTLLGSQKGADLKRMLFLVAESQYKLGQISQSALRFHEYLELKPELNVAHTRMRLGDCYRHLGDSDTASIYYQELIDEFPKSSEAESARIKISKIKIEKKKI